jgi:2'-5' RNA ligase
MLIYVKTSCLESLYPRKIKERDKLEAGNNIMMRLFIGVKLPDNIQEQIYNIRGNLPMTRWIEPGHLHVGVRFLGSIEESEAEEIHHGLAKINCRKFTTAAATTGFFAHGSVARTIWTGLSNFTAFDQLFSAVDSVCIAAGQAPQERPFHAHITTAKLDGCPIEKVQEYVAANNLFRSQEFTVDSFQIFSSRRVNFEEKSLFAIEHAYELK